jgi:hypothetical protein
VTTRLSFATYDRRMLVSYVADTGIYGHSGYYATLLGIICTDALLDLVGTVPATVPSADLPRDHPPNYPNIASQ